jgi:hypothetical protein
MNMRGRRHHQYRHISNRGYPPPPPSSPPGVTLVLSPAEEEEEALKEEEEKAEWRRRRKRSGGGGESGVEFGNLGKVCAATSPPLYLVFFSDFQNVWIHYW